MQKAFWICQRRNLKQLKKIPQNRWKYIDAVYPCLSELSNQLRYASQKRVLVEVALIKLTSPSMEPDLDSILQRLRQLEADGRSGSRGHGQRHGSVYTDGQAPANAGTQAPSDRAAPVQEAQVLRAVPADVSQGSRSPIAPPEKVKPPTGPVRGT